MTLQGGHRRAGGSVPDSGCVIIARGDNATSLGVEKRAADSEARYLPADGQLATTCGVPDSRRAVAACSDYALSVTAEGGIPDGVLVAYADAHTAAAARIPDSRCSIGTRCHDTSSIRAEYCADNRTGMTTAIGDARAGSGVPNTCRGVAACGDDAIATESVGHGPNHVRMAVCTSLNTRP